MQKLLTILLTAALLLCGCAAPASRPAESSSVPDAPPEFSEITNEEVGNLFVKAMREIILLAIDDPCAIVSSHVFEGETVEFDYDSLITIDGIPYVKTSKPYSELVDYYAQTFTDEALDWILSTKFFSGNDTLYCSLAGGASGYDLRLQSLEELQDQTYQANYVFIFFLVEGTRESEPQTTLFEVQQTDAGPRISSIDYCPDLLQK